jgi:hypothetical protein
MNEPNDKIQLTEGNEFGVDANATIVSGGMRWNDEGELVEFRFLTHPDGTHEPLPVSDGLFPAWVTDFLEDQHDTHRDEHEG